MQTDTNASRVLSCFDNGTRQVFDSRGASTYRDDREHVYHSDGSLCYSSSVTSPAYEHTDITWFDAQGDTVAKGYDILADGSFGPWAGVVCSVGGEESRCEGNSSHGCSWDGWPHRSTCTPGTCTGPDDGLPNDAGSTTAP